MKTNKNIHKRAKPDSVHSKQLSLGQYANRKNNMVGQKGTIGSNFELLKPFYTRLIPSMTDKLVEEYVQYVSDVHNKFVINLGVRNGTRHWKDIVTYCINLCEGRNPVNVDRVSTGRKDRWPNCLTKIRPLYHDIIDSNRTKEDKAEKLRFMQNLLKLNRICSDFSEMDIEDIQSTFQVPKDLQDEFERFIARRLNGCLVTPFEEWEIPPILGNSRGPNSVPKIESGPAEAHALLESDLGKHYKIMCEETQQQGLYDFTVYYKEKYIQAAGDNIQTDIRLRKLSAIPDKGNKSRIIAISDMWTQLLLSGLENEIVRITQTMFGDKSAYFSHSDGWNRLIENHDDSYVSLDAKAWTDNLPNRLQYLVVKQLMGQRIADSWRKLAVDCDWSLGNTNHTVRYGKGQGMGTKGSFAIATLTDHLIIEMVLEKEYGYVTDYIKVGDDLVVSDRNRVLQDFYPTIGVPINLSKSKFTTSSGCFTEFVSRNSWDKKDISIFSPTLLVKAYKQPFLSLTLLDHFNERVEKHHTLTFDQLVNYCNWPEGTVNKVKYLNYWFQIFHRFEVDSSLEPGGLHESIREEVFIFHFCCYILELLIELDRQYELSDYHMDVVKDYEFTKLITLQSNRKWDHWSHFKEKDVPLKILNLMEFGRKEYRGELELDGTRDMDHFYEVSRGVPVLYDETGDSHLLNVENLLKVFRLFTMVRKALTGRKALMHFSPLHTANIEHTVDIFKELNKVLNRCIKEPQPEISLRHGAFMNLFGFTNVMNQLNKLIHNDCERSQ